MIERSDRKNIDRFWSSGIYWSRLVNRARAAKLTCGCSERPEPNVGPSRGSGPEKEEDTPLKMLINGQSVDAASGSSFAVRNPATGEIIDTVPQAGPEDVHAAIEVALRGK